MVAYLFGELVKGWEGIFPFFLRNINTLSDHFAYNHPESLNLGRIIESFKIFNVFACKFHLLQEVAEILQTDCVIRSNFWPSCQLPLKISTDYGSVAKVFLEDFAGFPIRLLWIFHEILQLFHNGFGFTI